MKVTCKNKNKTVSFETNEKVFITKIIKDVCMFIYTELDDEWFLFEIENNKPKHYKIINNILNTKHLFLYSKLINNKLYVKNII